MADPKEKENQVDWTGGLGFDNLIQSPIFAAAKHNVGIELTADSPEALISIIWSITEHTSKYIPEYRRMPVLVSAIKNYLRMLKLEDLETFISQYKEAHPENPDMIDLICEVYDEKVKPTEKEEL